MPKRINLAGRSFGKLSVIEDAGKDKHGAVMWRCKCECGKETVARGSSLTQGTTASCGCGVSGSAIREGTTHGMTGNKIYSAWQSMKSRCRCKRSKNYKNYGGRGISVCARWQFSFENFFADMGASFFDGAELDRKDNSGNYEPSNCRWLTKKGQQRNKRTNHNLTISGITKTIAEWGEETGLKPNTILTRVRRDWPEHRLLKIENS